MSLAPLTASSIVDAKIDQVQSRLTFLWAAAHSNLALTHPAVTAVYMRQLRSLAFHHDIQLATKETHLNFCTSCCAVLIPSVNATVRVGVSRERRKRRKRAQKRRKYAEAAANETEGETDAEQAEPSDVKMQDVTAATDSEADAADAAASAMSRKRKRSLSPAAHASHNSTAAPSSAFPSSSSTTAHSAHEISAHCHRCGHVDRVLGMSAKQRALLHASNTDLAALVSSAIERSAAPALEEARAVAAKKSQILGSLKSQLGAKNNNAPQPTLASMSLLNQAQQRFQQSKQQLTVGGNATATTNVPSVASNSFFQEQFKSAAGLSTPLIEPSPPASKPSAPFSFSRSTAAPLPKAPLPGGSLYALLQQSTTPQASAQMQTPVHVPTAPFVHSAAKKSTPSSTPNKSATKPAQPPTMMQGIQIAMGMKSAAPAKSYTIPVKGKNNNNQRRY